MRIWELDKKIIYRLYSSNEKVFYESGDWFIKISSYHCASITHHNCWDEIATMQFQKLDRKDETTKLMREGK